MNKKEFIKLLEEKLSILDEEELKDIINEYKDTIDEKVKHGESEEDAVADFGSIDELTKEILKAYKINPKYGEKKDNVKEVINDCESSIKRGAKKLARFSKNIVADFKNSNNNLTVELVFEILIKAIILLFLFAILRLPFILIDHLGASILDIAFYPINEILIFVWRLILFVLYFVCCVMLSIAMFKNYFNNPEPKNNKKNIKKKVVEKESNKEEVIKEEPRKDKGNLSNTLGNVLKVIFQVFMVVVFLIPLWFIVFGILLGLILSIYYLCIGINTLGLLIMAIGGLILFVHISNIVHSITFSSKKIYFFPFIISLVFISVGFLLTFNTIANIHYIKEIPDNSFDLKTETYEIEVNKDTFIHSYGALEYILDDTLENGKIKIDVTYYDNLNDVYYDKYDLMYDNSSQIHIYRRSSDEFESGWKLYNLVIDNLKENRFYRYDLLYEYKTKVRANKTTMNLLKKD